MSTVDILHEIDYDGGYPASAKSVKKNNNNINSNNIELTLLSKEEIWGENKLEVLQKYGTKAAISDLCILTGSYLADTDYNVLDSSLDCSKRGTSLFWTKSEYYGNDICIVYQDGFGGGTPKYLCSSASSAVRPVLEPTSVLYSQIAKNKVKGYNGTYEVEYGEYPQYAAEHNIQLSLDREYQLNSLNQTGRHYTFDSVRYDDLSTGIREVTYDEYEYKGKKYIRVKANSDFGEEAFELSNGKSYRDGDFVWVEVSPVKWLVDDKTSTLISKIGLVSGIRYLGEKTQYKGDFSKTEMYMFLNKYMAPDLFQPSIKVEQTIEESKIIKKENPYGFKTKEVSEEEVIKGYVESGVAVFLHGQSSEGKSARVKQIDPDCVTIYMRGATPDSLNGKSVLDPKSGEMIDIKPTWLKTLERKCEKEPEKIHILFFDELTNALPSIQGLAFNIVLDKEVNGKWKLPENARIVAAGNEMEDSLAANQLAEPMFNRFAHVYIKTTVESWLKWASENNIHPAIYSYIAYKGEEVLRSKYDGEKPNADPRKWEMASKVLYQTENPEMLRALVGEEITKEFVAFCNTPVITLEDVINGNYSEEDIQLLDISERYATTYSLCRVDEDNIEKVREFVLKIGPEFCALFDLLWIHGDESRLERISELSENSYKLSLKF